MGRKSRNPAESGLRTAAPFVMIHGGEWAARQGRGVCGWANDIIPGAVQIVLTNVTAPGLIYNLRPGTTLMLTQYCYAVETAADSCTFEFGYCDAINGGGTFYPLGPHKHVRTPNAPSGLTSFDQEIIPAERLSYLDGVRSITFRVLANDVTCEITMGWHGWWEPDR